MRKTDSSGSLSSRSTSTLSSAPSTYLAGIPRSRPTSASSRSSARPSSAGRTRAAPTRTTGPDPETLQNQLIQAKKQLNAEGEKSRAAQTELRSEVARLQSEVKHLKEMQSDFFGTAGMENAALTDAYNRLDRALRANAKAKAKAKELIAARSKAEQELAEYKGNLKVRHLSDLRTQLTGFESHNSELQAEVQHLRQMLRNAEEEHSMHTAVKERNLSLEADVRRLQ
ncbi:hypothetical protein CYMTET_8126, partial [Cymbomonas tetramitiformis]